MAKLQTENRLFSRNQGSCGLLDQTGITETRAITWKPLWECCHNYNKTVNICYSCYSIFNILWKQSPYPRSCWTRSTFFLSDCLLKVRSILKHVLDCGAIIWAITACSPFEVNVNFQWTTRRYIPEELSLHNHRCENLTFYKTEHARTALTILARSSLLFNYT
jgi:hypothetical protein